MVARETGSMKERIRRIVIDDPGINTDTILDKIAKGRSRDADLPSRFMVESIRFDTRQTLRVLKELGHLRNSVRI